MLKMLIVTLAATASLAAVEATSFRRMQQFGNQWRPQNAMPNAAALGNTWPQVGSPWGNQGVGAAGGFPQVGAAVNGLQTGNVNSGMQPESLEQATTTAPPAAQPAQPATPSTVAPAVVAGGEQPAPQATIMVLLPDFLAPTTSGSGSTMMVAGSPDGTSGGVPGAKSGDTVAADSSKKSAAVAATRTAAAATIAVALLSALAIGLF